jgi:hypothetical protein
MFSEILLYFQNHAISLLIFSVKAVCTLGMLINVL